MTLNLMKTLSHCLSYVLEKVPLDKKKTPLKHYRTCQIFFLKPAKVSDIIFLSLT